MDTVDDVPATDEPMFEHFTAEELDADIEALRERLPTLEAVERRREHLWIVAALLLIAASAMVFILLFIPDAPELLPDNDALRAASGIVSLAFLLYVFDQERRMRRLSRALVDERILSSLLNERVRDLATLSQVGQVVNSVLTTDEVLRIILSGARELTGAVTGSVMLVDGDELVVETSAGDEAAPTSARQPLYAGIAGRVIERREPIMVNGDVAREQVSDRQPRRRSGGSAVIAPMLVNDDLIGVLSLNRPLGADDFTQWELRAVALFANHAATAVTNAKRFETERENVSRLADMIERRSEFVATLVHDLKTPLTAISGYTQLLSLRSDQLGPDAQQTAVKHIDDASTDLLNMVNDVLRSASFEAAEPLRTEPVALQPFLHGLVEAVQTGATSKEGRPRPVQLRAPGQRLFMGDPSVLRSILQNLLENAVKYSPPGSPVELEVVPSDGHLRFSVRDRGRGIPPDEQELVFERFRRQRPSDTTDGVGLGLYIVRSLVRAQGGRISIESEVGVGTTFHVTLPDRHPSDPSTNGLPRPPEASSEADAAQTTAPPPPPTAPAFAAAPAPAAGQSTSSSRTPTPPPPSADSRAAAAGVLPPPPPPIVVIDDAARPKVGNAVG